MLLMKEIARTETCTRKSNSDRSASTLTEMCGERGEGGEETGACIEQQQYER